jgi:hypothetical protein
MVGDAGEHRAQVGFGIEAVELGGADQGVERGGPFPAGIGTGEEKILSSERNGTVILPISGKKSPSTTAGMGSMDVGSKSTALNPVAPERWSTSKRRRAS